MSRKIIMSERAAANLIGQVSPKRKEKTKQTLFITPDFRQRLLPAWSKSSVPDGLLRGVLKALDMTYGSSERVSIPALPKTANGMWIKGARSMYLHPDAKVFKQMVFMGINRLDHLRSVMSQAFIPVMVFESNQWVTQDGNVRRQRDVDNRIKPTLDALAEAVGTDDANAWHVMAFKLPSKEERTTVFLYPLGRQLSWPSISDSTKSTMAPTV